jgi:hypothetical protein
MGSLHLADRTCAHNALEASWVPNGFLHALIAVQKAITEPEA